MKKGRVDHSTDSMRDCVVIFHNEMYKRRVGR